MHDNLGIGSWIARQARIAPDRVALVFGDRRWTYRQLADRIARLAGVLAARGIADGDRVAFLGHNHPAALEVLFACGLLGAIAVPLHPGFDRATLRAVLADAGPRLLVVTPALQQAVPDGTVPTLVVDAAYEELLARATPASIDRPLGLDRTGVLAFTSGTTARSRGVMLSHGNLLFNAINLLARLDLVRDDVILTSAPLYRMGGLGFLLPVLLKGGTCVLQEVGDPAVSVRLIAQHRVTILFDAVHALDALRRAPAFATADLSSLRICVTGGSYVPAELCDAYRRRGIALQPGYGLTEAAPVALLADPEDAGGHPGTAGRPPPFVSVRVVDAALAEVAPGATGELLVRGPNVMTGYWHAPDATAAALVTGGWLRTGDAARAGADGTIAILGRVADAVVLGGERVHPGPLEEELRAEVAECALVQAAPEARPTLFVLPRPGRAPDLQHLRARCRRQLGTSPAVVVVAALPKNPNGKILRGELARSLQGRDLGMRLSARSPRPDGHAAPRSPAPGAGRLRQRRPDRPVVAPRRTRPR